MLEEKKNLLKINFDDFVNKITPSTLNLTEQGKYDIIEVENMKENLTPEQIHSFKEIINEGGKLILIFDENFKNENNAMMKNVSNMKFAGYIETKIETIGNIFKLTGKKRKSNKDKKQENPWKNINLEVKSELLLEEELVDPFDSYQKFSKKSDCITKPKPCKGCNCGRAEKENKEKTTEMTSSCGRCYLGDAFRCAGCPYKGQPAFEPGEKIDFMNVNGESKTEKLIESEEVNVKLDKSNRIKIDL